MGNLVKSVREADKISKGLSDLATEVVEQKLATQKNNRELQKLNKATEVVQQDKITRLEEEIKQMKADSKWVNNEKPAIDLNPNHILRKLNIL